MKFLDKKEYERTLKELMETPFGGYQQTPTITQHEPMPKVINERPLETQITPVSTTSQPQIHIIKEQQPQPSPLSLQKTELSLTRLGIAIAVGGAIFGYLYTTNPSVQTTVKMGLTKLSTFMDNPAIMMPVVLGVFLCTLGLIFRR